MGLSKTSNVRIAETGIVSRVGECVDKNHHLRNGGVEGKRLDVFGHFLDRGVQTF